MSIFSLIGLALLLVATFGVKALESRSDKMTLIMNNRDAFNVSLDLLYMNRHQELPVKDPNDSTLRFFVIGDFGAYFNYRELSSATDAMNDLAIRYAHDHIVTVGDNIYWKGIENINIRWQPWLTFSVFKKSALKNIMVYPTLGNHDCYVDMFNEVRYSKYDYQWRLESEYYAKVTPLKDDPNKQFVNLMLNSCRTICPKGNPYKFDNDECTKFGFEAGSSEVQAHYDWIEEQLKTYSQDPKTAWIAVTMHHQPYVHPGMKLSLIPLLRKYGVDIIIAGHEHWLEYSNQEYDHQWKYLDVEYGPVVNNCTDNEIFTTETREIHQTYGERFHQFTVGTAGAVWIDPVCPVKDMDVNLVFRSVTQTGSMSVEVTTDLFKASFLNADGTIPYKVYIHKPKSSE